MSMLRVAIILACIFSLSHLGIAQQLSQSNEPTFTPFHGNVYKIPEHRLMHGFKNEVYQYKVYKKITWDAIHVSDRKVDDGFPDIDLRTAFGIIFKSKMTIPVDGYYKFSINSDDGSIIWIDNKLVVHNDYHHGMNKEENIIQLTEGVHDVKIWYYQAYENRYGIEFAAKFMKEIPPAVQLPRVITIQDEVLFDHDKYELSYMANNILDSLSSIIKDYENIVINIDGHTDSDGSDEYNINLSNDRSSSVLKALRLRNNHEKIKYVSMGYGYHHPIDTNETEEGKQKNRRVVITIRKDGSGDPYFKENTQTTKEEKEY